MFFKGSRYENVATNEITAPDGRIYRYKKTRFIGPATPQRAHSLTGGDRLDLIAHLHFRDSERFWRICDANYAMWPDDLIAHAGRNILVPNAEE
jgi:hypothetical protein